MPGWHEATKKLQEEGKVKMVGILQEQHPRRAELFMQWKQMGWPLLVDSLNLLEVEVVPITALVDEHGIVRQLRPKPQDVEAFLNERYEPPEKAVPAPIRPALAELRAATLKEDTPAAWRDYGHSLLLWENADGLDSAIDALSRTLEQGGDPGRAHFELGVAYRERYDSLRRRNGDFRNAVDHWTRALEMAPNQYIWRRRIQQYGPRLEKPYPFYDWVEEARTEIRARGEIPVELAVEPRGAEIAQPAKSFVAAGTAAEPDPAGRIYRDQRGFIEIETVVVPAVLRAGEPGRVHMVFRPNVAIQSHWNNEADDLRLWLDPAPGWQVDHQLLSVPNPRETVSIEPRRLEFEVRPPEDAVGTEMLQGYALYYVCEDIDGTCLFRRQDLQVEVRIMPEGKGT